MILREIQLPKFIAASFVFHVLLFGALTFINSPKADQGPLEISFGLGNSRGGSSPKVSAPKKAQAPKVKSPTPRVINPEAPVMAVKPETKEVEVSDSENTIAESGSGLGTTSGSGSGVTSGSGAGFNDPKIRYRGEIYQLVNSKKVYPRKARALQQEGTVVAKLKLSKDGKLLNLEIVEEAKFKILTKATLDAIKSIKKFPEIPSEMGLNEITINIPFEYEIRHGDII